jgi:hypothetical protein
LVRSIRNPPSADLEEQSAAFAKYTPLQKKESREMFGFCEATSGQLRTIANKKWRTVFLVYGN